MTSLPKHPLPEHALTESPWKEVNAARIPWVELAALGSLRVQPDVLVNKDGDFAWVRWGKNPKPVIDCLLGVPRVLFFCQKGADWIPYGRTLPTGIKPPREMGDPVSVHLSPIPPQFSLEASEPVTPLPWRLVRGGTEQPVIAQVCSLENLAKWAQTATTIEIESCLGLCFQDRALLRGQHMPSITGAQRLWGNRVWIPLGWVMEPLLTEEVLLDALKVDPQEIVWCQEKSLELVSLGDFAPLTRAGIKLAYEESKGHGETRP